MKIKTKDKNSSPRQKYMNNSDLRIILLIINWEQNTKYQLTISDTPISRNV